MSQTIVSAIAPTCDRLLPFATKIEAIRIFNNAVQVTYWTSHGRCSTFLSIRAFIPRAISERFQVGDILKITSIRHGEFFYQLPALVTAATSSIGVVVEVMGLHRWFGNEELMMVRPVQALESAIIANPQAIVGCEPYTRGWRATARNWEQPIAAHGI